jgi:PKD repeat protein
VAQTKSTTVFQGQEVVFDGSTSTDDVTPRSELTFSWDLDGDGEEDATGVLATFTYDELGTREVTLTVTDEEGRSDTDTIEVTVIDEVDEVVRVEGPDRVRTAIELSREAFPDSSEVDVAVLATAGDFPDALAAGSLAIAAEGRGRVAPAGRGDRLRRWW